MKVGKILSSMLLIAGGLIVMPSVATAQSGYGSFKVGNGSLSCFGSYTGFANMTNSQTATLWFTAPAGATNCIITDTSGIGSPYASVVLAFRRSNGQTWCGTNSVSIPVIASQQYKFTIYTKDTTPPPTAGQVLTVSVAWNP